MIGLVVCAAIGGVVGTVAVSLETFVAAIVGAAISVAGFGLFVLGHYMLGRRLEAVATYVYEQWLGRIAPIIGGAVGAAVGSRLIASGIYIVALSALIGGVAVPILESITGEKRSELVRDIIALAVAGMIYGAINGVILAMAFKILKAIRWI